MNKYEITELDLKNGYSFDQAEAMNAYLYALLKVAGIKTANETHKKARAIYFRFLVSEKYKDKDVDFLNDKANEFLNEWAKNSDSGNVNAMISQLLTVETNQHLSAVVRIVLDIAKKNQLADRARELQQQKMEKK